MGSTHRRLLSAAILAALAIVAVAAAALGQEHEEVIISDTLRPARLEVSSGTVVTWRNRDAERHRVRSRQGPVEFDSGNLEPGERFSVTFIVPGEYPYRDERADDDPAYVGAIVVRGEQVPDGPAASATITLIDESFQPPTIEVSLGASVTWQNIDGDDDHTVTSTEGVFDSGILAAGSAFEHTFDTPGAYGYFCAIHPEMTGTITVVGGDTGAVHDPATEPVPPHGTADPDITAGDTGAVTIADLTFQPSIVTIERGSTVTWTNADGVPHTTTADDGAFDSGVLATGAGFSRTFDATGTYGYACAIHPSMTGTVVVVEPSATGPDEPAVIDTTPAVTAVSIVDVAFEPADIVVPAGTTVDWSNDDPFEHTVTARDGTFDSGAMAPGRVFSRTFDSDGTYEYLCAIHSSMTGTVTVTPAGDP